MSATPSPLLPLYYSLSPTPSSPTPSPFLKHTFNAKSGHALIFSSSRPIDLLRSQQHISLNQIKYGWFYYATI